ncbi:MAG: hypothetical protein R3F28_16655 [Candidatus Kapaibacterium sp.]
MIKEGILAVDVRCVENSVDELHLGDARSIDSCLLNKRVLLQEVRIHENVMEFRNPAVSVADDTDEVWSALVNLFEAGADDGTEGSLLVGQSPTEVNVGKCDSSASTECTDLGEDLLDQMLPFFPQVAEGRRDKNSEFVAL